MSKMTNAWPVTPGFYWLLVPGGVAEVVEVHEERKGAPMLEVRFIGIENAMAIEDEALREARWSAPLFPPHTL
ncbi:hypothetical protein [Burkholderia sp. Ac-20365]|uniref:hypothetical protein n=1 Tax=Burkholderia sp. Ac-20365 TaxID=2703897 RepID=UPI00197C9099|nr:hypothetical protein [Burkholderia sp. Ac-20365]MBN3761378.1 hypothetical protein [Burkholderia sp. Ac-20365]